MTELFLCDKIHHNCNHRMREEEEYMEGRHSAPNAPAQAGKRSETEYVQRTPAPRRRRRRSAWRFVPIDLLMTGLILLCFAFFHHVLPRMTATPVAPIQTVVTPSPTVRPAETPVEENPTDETVSNMPVVETVPTEEAVEDGRTEWQRRFADKFTEEVEQTENHYSSPNICVDVTTYVDTSWGYYTTYYVADIYVARIENFQTVFATGQYIYYGAENPLSIDRETDAIVAVNGDYCNNQTSGLLVRNGDIYMTEQTEGDICVLFYDGTMRTYEATAYAAEDILAMSPYQTWKFGPELLDNEGNVKASFRSNDSIEGLHPRTGVGYYEPGHYCLVVVDGRQNHSVGATMEQFAKIFADLGCKTAYNLDGGASSVMTFNDRIHNKQSNGGRDSGDMIIIRELEETEEVK